jgi:hypothetical protein
MGMIWNFRNRFGKCWVLPPPEGASRLCVRQAASVERRIGTWAAYTLVLLDLDGGFFV